MCQTKRPRYFFHLTATQDSSKETIAIVSLNDFCVLLADLNWSLQVQQCKQSSPSYLPC